MNTDYELTRQIKLSNTTAFAPDESVSLNLRVDNN